MVVMWDHVVPAPRDRKLKDIRRWLVENVGTPDEDWGIVIDVGVVDFFSKKINPTIRQPPVDIFNVGFKKEEDKVKFILSFL